MKFGIQSCLGWGVQWTSVTFACWASFSPLVITFNISFWDTTSPPLSICMVKVGPAPQWARDPGLTNQSLASPGHGDWLRTGHVTQSEPCKLRPGVGQGGSRSPGGREWTRPKSGDRCTRVCYNVVVYACLLRYSDLPVLKVSEVERERNQKAAQKDPIGLWYGWRPRHTWTWLFALKWSLPALTSATPDGRWADKREVWDAWLEKVVPALSRQQAGGITNGEMEEEPSHAAHVKARRWKDGELMRLDVVGCGWV